MTRRRPSEKLDWPAGNMLSPLPAVLVTCADGAGRSNMLTVAWAGTVCTNPPMLAIGVRPERFSYPMIEATGEFTVNLTTAAMARAVDLAGVRSGRDCDKWALTGLTPLEGHKVGCPMVAEAPVAIECRVNRALPLGSHTLLIADVVNTVVDSRYVDPATGALNLGAAGLISYTHGHYYAQGPALGRFGFSVRRRK